MELLELQEPKWNPLLRFTKPIEGWRFTRTRKKQFFTSLEPESKFDGLKEAKEFIDEQKKQRNPSSLGDLPAGA